MKPISLVFLVLVVGLWHVNAQQMHTIGDQAIVKIEGTSTMHDWQMETVKVSGKAEFILGENQVKGIKSLYVTIPSESLKSGKGAMDKNAYKALKTDDHKEISFRLTDVSNVEKSGDKYVLTCVGKLTVAGITRDTQLVATLLPKGNGAIQAMGKKVINMTDYQVEPPSFMFGSVKTGDRIEVGFDVTFIRTVNQ